MEDEAEKPTWHTIIREGSRWRMEGVTKLEWMFDGGDCSPSEATNEIRKLFGLSPLVGDGLSLPGEDDADPPIVVEK